MKNFNFIGIIFFCFFLACENIKSADSNTEIITAVKNNRIPFVDTLEKNHIIVKALINQKPVYLVVDNGTHPDYYIILFKPAAAAIGLIDTLKPFRLETERIAATPYSISLSEFRDTSKGIVVHNYGILPKDKLSDGILGMGFLKKYIVAIDYNQKYLEIFDTANFVVPKLYEEITFKPPYDGPLRNLDILLYINGKNYPENVSLDLGYSLPGFYLSTYHYEKNKKVFDTAGDTTESFSAIRKAVNKSVILDSVTILDKTIANIPSLVALKGNTYSNSILFGNDILQRFGKIYLQLGSNKMYIKR